MKKKSLKIVAAAFACTSLLALGGCGEEKDPYTLYTEATQKTSELKSMEATSNMSISMTFGEENMDMDMVMDIKTANPGTADMQADIAMTTSVLGQSMTMQSYFSEGYYYLDAGTGKIKYPMEVAEMEKQLAGTNVMEGLKKEDFKEISMEKKDKDKIITYTISGDSMSSMVDTVLGAMAGQLGEAADMDMNISDITGSSTITADEYFSDVTLSMPFDISAQGQTITATIDMALTYVNPGKEVKVELPEDLDTYQDLGTAVPDSAAETPNAEAAAEEPAE